MRSTSRLARLAHLVALAAVLCASAPASARADATPEQRDEAREHGEEGLRLFGAERYEEAYRQFLAADWLYHAPTLALYIARSLRKLGRLVEARARYEKILAEPLPESPSEAFVEAHESARTELSRLKQAIPSLRVLIVGSEAHLARASVDGKPVTRERLDLDPGKHTITLSRSGAPPLVKTVTLAEGERAEIELAALPEAAPRTAPGSLVPTGIAFGAGGAMLGVGAVTGALSLAKVAEVRSHCDGDRCFEKYRADVDSAKRLGDVATAALILGGVGAATGVVLLVVRQRRTSTKPAATKGVAWALGAGPGRLDLSARF